MNVKVHIRPITLDDVTEEYVSWLQDPEVNRYLETRHTPQTLETVRDYVRGMIKSKDSWLFAIVNQDELHLGNIKIGPRHPRHNTADISYFIGNKGMWNQGCASQAIRLATEHAFTKLDIHRLQAGFYWSNIGSRKALINNGYFCDGSRHNELKNWQGEWEDHVLFGLTKEEWEKERQTHA